MKLGSHFTAPVSSSPGAQGWHGSRAEGWPEFTLPPALFYMCRSPAGGKVWASNSQLQLLSISDHGHLHVAEPHTLHLYLPGGRIKYIVHSSPEALSTVSGSRSALDHVAIFIKQCHQDLLNFILIPNDI
jgi:hypothetical protein